MLGTELAVLMDLALEHFPLKEATIWGGVLLG